ncbi:hypothetical protein T484DRAFT_3374345 [Baffinella frigidus]|nr:hypothetical protein T484DRAFT_3374345 [Cryptophyta sp. CCMP2293]
MDRSGISRAMIKPLLVLLCMSVAASDLFLAASPAKGVPVLRAVGANTDKRTAAPLGRTLLPLTLRGGGGAGIPGCGELARASSHLGTLRGGRDAEDAAVEMAPAMRPEQLLSEAKDTVVCTPLHEAAEHGRDADVEKLLAAGADLEAKDASGRTPLHFASMGGHDGVVCLLVKRGRMERLRRTGKDGRR